MMEARNERERAKLAVGIEELRGARLTKRNEKDRERRAMLTAETVEQIPL